MIFTKSGQLIIKITEYTYTYKQNQNSLIKIKYNRLTWQTKEIKVISTN